MKTHSQYTSLPLASLLDESKPARSLHVHFINPPVPTLDKSYAKLLTFNTIPLALLYPATVLKQAGHHVTINDVKSGEKLQIPRSAHIVGITTDTVRYYDAIAIARLAKKMGKIVVMGGNHVTFDTEKTLRTGVVDFIVRGEGDVTILNLVNALSQKDGCDPHTINGVSWYNKKEDVVVNNPAGHWIQDLDALPLPDHSILNNMELYRKKGFNRFGKLGKPQFQISGSRGCPYECSFCIVTSVYGAKWRHRSPDSILHEVQQALKLGFDTIFFTDDIFSINYKRTMEFCEEVLRRNMKFSWTCQCSCDSIAKHPDMVELMARAGCEAVLLGVESMDESALTLYRKRATVDNNFEAVKNLKKHNIISLASTIVGTPQETHESINRNFGYLMELAPEMLWVNILTPYIGTDDWELYQDRIFDRNWQHYDVYHSVMKLDNLSPSEVEFAQRRMMTMYYTRPKYMFRTLPNLFNKQLWSNN
ncbi:MAG: radical SAM protein [Chloroflexi bacterium]|uniref:Radical SAM protein n=1 Tax=Candidatus Chlorohelix allophototropha TaxID=3003348 RepID=A0A8T7M3R6_9CHLR|nr:radical SAM protein [Chloroflexota bacterium]WJW66086.1 B12-binding domain-containing radical SAM protein [Chloroflexota bacterium L227-S17]